MSASKKRTPRLGRGLSSLMAHPVSIDVEPEVSKELSDNRYQPDGTHPETRAVSDEKSVETERQQDHTLKHEEISRLGSPDAEHPPESELHRLHVKSIQVNPYQPRQSINHESLKSLAESIRSEGMMQPIVVRPLRKLREDIGRPDNNSDASTDIADPEIVGGGYQLVAGERRWRAAQIAGLEYVPAFVRQLDDRQTAEWALIENLQREDLNPIERAEAFHQLADQFNLSHDQIARRVGLDRSTVTNLLRLLNLADSVRQLVAENLLSMGHARALAGLTDLNQQQYLAEKAIRKGLSVRALEAEVRKISRQVSPDSELDKSTPNKPAKSVYLADLEQQIAQQLGTRVKIRAGRKKGSGSMTIDFYSLDQFDSLIARLGVEME